MTREKVYRFNGTVRAPFLRTAFHVETFDMTLN